MSNQVKASGSNGLLLGMIIGGAVGAISTLLLAPKTGSEMRETLCNKYSELTEKTGDLVSAIGEKSQKIAHTVGSEASDLLQQAKQSSERVADHVRSAKDDIEQKAASTASSARE